MPTRMSCQQVSLLVVDMNLTLLPSQTTGFFAYALIESPDQAERVMRAMQGFSLAPPVPPRKYLAARRRLVLPPVFPCSRDALVRDI